MEHKKTSPALRDMLIGTHCVGYCIVGFFILSSVLFVPALSMAWLDDRFDMSFSGKAPVQEPMSDRALSPSPPTELEKDSVAATRREPDSSVKALNPQMTAKLLENPASGMEDSEILAKDGDYIKYKTGIVLDTKKHLEWVAGPDNDTTWDEAKDWVSNLDLDGGNWRMPSKSELRWLCKPGAGDRTMTHLLTTNGVRIWTGEKTYNPIGPDGSEMTDTSYAFFFYLLNNGIYSQSRKKGKESRVYAVRVKKE